MASTAGPARAADPAVVQQCIAAYDKAQVLRRARKLTAARDELVVCSQSKCPGATTADCGPWLREVESTLPSIVVVARDASGNDIPAVKVTVDGVVLTARLSGTPLDVDPGEHQFTFEPELGQRVEQRLLINVGEKNRLVQVVIRPDAPAVGKPATAAPASGQRGSLVPGIVVGAIGLASLGASFGLYFSAKSGADNLRATCAPHCDPADVSSLRTRGIVSDVTFGVGLAGLGAGVLMILLRPTEKPAAAAPAVGLVRPTLLFAPIPGGAVTGLTARF
jgi:hypothetical protein